MCFQSHCHRCAKFASRSMSSNGSDETAQWIRQRRFMDVAKVDVQKVGVTEEDRDRNRWTQMIHSVNPKWCSWKTKGSEINTLYESILSLINSLVFSFPTSYEFPFLLLALLVSVLFHLSYSVVCLNPCAQRKDIYFRLVFTLNNSYLYAVAFEPLFILQVCFWKLPLVCLCDKCYYNKVYKMSHFARAAWGADRSNGLWQEETKDCKEEGRNLFLPV